VIEIPFERHRLDNGLRVILARDPALPVVAVNLWYSVGSRNERPGRTGFAHLFEHMMFQGSENVPDNGHFALIEKAGGSLNGSTWLDRTNYYETLPAHYADLALWLEADRMGGLLPAMTQEKLDNQRDVVKNERRWRVDNQPYGDWDERLQALMYPSSHPYHHSVIGSMEDLDAASLEDVAGFFRTYYAPNNAVLSVCGDFEPAAVVRTIESYFGTIPAGPPVPPIPGTTELPPTLGAQVRETVEQDVSMPRLYLAYRMPRYGDDRFHAAAVTSFILTWGKASVLYRSLVRGTPLLQDVTAFAFPVVVGASMLVVWATVRPGISRERAEEAILERVGALRDVDDADVERAKNLIENRNLQQLQRAEHRADHLSMYTTLFDDPSLINTEIGRLRAVTTQDVRALAAELLGEDNRVLLWYVPGGVA